MELKKQLNRWADKHLAGVFIGLGFTKATEVVIRHFFGELWSQFVVWLVLGLVMMVIAAKHPDIDV